MTGRTEGLSGTFKVFAREKLPVETGRVGILGMTPQDVSDLKAADKLRENLSLRGTRQSATEWEMGLMK